MTNEYPASYVIRIKAADGIIFLVGLCLLAAPALIGLYPGDIDTTVHITLGALICVCSVFRVLVAYGSAWLEIVLAALGVLTFLLPVFMNAVHEPRYHTGHMIAGGIIIALSILSGLMTFIQLRNAGPASTR